MLLDTNTPDDALLAEIVRDPAIIARAQQHATATYNKARALPRSPSWSMDRDWQDFRRRADTVTRHLSPFPTGPERQRGDLQRFRIALEAVAEFGKYLNMTPAEREQAWAADREAASRALLASQAPTPAPVQMFDPRAFLDGLAGRGIAVSADRRGNLNVTGASRLTDNDRHILHTHKSAISAAVEADAETF